MSRHGEGMPHGSHPEHGASFFPMPNLHEEQVCAICHATAFRAEAAWYSCCAPQCDVVLCHKCFDVDETLLPVPQIVMRNPALPYAEATRSSGAEPPRRPVAVHTRPKMISFQLAPIYPGKLLEIVSRTVSKEEGVVYFRLKSGGWICASNVIVVTATDESSNITKLTDIHVAGAREAALQDAQGLEPLDQPVPARVCEQDLLACMRESMQLIDANLPYGMVMCSLVRYPLLSATANPRLLAVSSGRGTSSHRHAVVTNEEDSCVGPLHPEALETRQQSAASLDTTADFSDDFVLATMQLTHLTLHAALDDIAQREAAQEPLDQGTILSLYGDVIGGCLLALQQLTAVGGVVLPEAFVPLVLRALSFFATVSSTLLRRIQPGENEDLHVSRLRDHAVQRDNADQATEQHRVYHVARSLTAVCSQLVQTSLRQHPLWLRQLVPLRHQLIYIKDETLEAVFCDLVTHSLTSPCSAPTSHKQLFLVDPLEVAVRLMKKATLAVSQISALQMMHAAAGKDPRTIATITSVALPYIVEALVAPRSSSVVVAALDCLSELAFNDPRREPTPSFETPKRVTSRNDEESYGRETASTAQLACMCSQALHPASAPFQTVHVYQLSGGLKVGLCSECAEQHPPAGVEDVCEPEFAHFQCQCPLCARRSASQPLPPPEVPATSSITLLQSGELWSRVSQRVRTDADKVAVLNAVGRLALRLAAPVDVIHSLAAALVQKVSLASCADAVLAVAANRHMPSVHDLLAMYSTSLLSRFVLTPYAAEVDMGRYGSRATSHRKPPSGCADFVTPSQSHVKSELGLSPSPSFTGSAGVYSSIATDRQASHSTHLGHPSVDLFPTASSAVGFGTA